MPVSQCVVPQFRLWNKFPAERLRRSLFFLRVINCGTSANIAPLMYENPVTDLGAFAPAPPGRRKKRHKWNLQPFQGGITKIDCVTCMKYEYGGNYAAGTGEGKQCEI